MGWEHAKNQMINGWGKLGPVCGVILCPIVIVFVWTSYLEKFKPFPEKVRRLLLLVVVALTSAEVYLMRVDSIHPWFVWPLLLVNGWGYFDACLRFPVLHDIDSFFVFKNVILLGCKIFMLAFGFKKMKGFNSTCTMLLLMILNLIGMPALYLIALPFDEDEVDQRLAAHDSTDADIAVSAYRFVTDSTSRRDTLDSFRKRATPKLSTEIMQNKVVNKIVEDLSPTHRKPISPTARRSV